MVKMVQKVREVTRETAVRLYEAMELRHSRRSYTGEPLRADVRAALAEYVQDGWEPYPGTHTRAVLLEGVETTSRVFKGVIGRYGSVQNAPALVAFVVRIDEPYFYEACGYMGEQIALYATSLGLDTCWVGGLFRPEVAGELTQLSEQERVVAVLAVGTAKEGGMSGFYEGLFKFGSSQRGKRKSAEEISYLEDVEPPRWFSRAVEAVRIAPSSYNKQPWHLMFHKEGRISISTMEEYKDKAPVYPGAPNSSRLCCGIAMAHLRIATRAMGVEGRWVPEEEFGNPIASFFVPLLQHDDEVR
jgi:nitroreductase